VGTAVQSTPAAGPGRAIGFVGPCGQAAEDIASIEFDISSWFNVWQYPPGELASPPLPSQEPSMLKRPTILSAVGALATAVTLTIAIGLAPGAQAASTAGAPTVSTDTAPPGVPTGLTISVNCSLQVTLGWNASTDDVGVSGYDVYRGNPGSPFNSAGTSTTTTFSERLAATQYEVRARDAAGNVSAFTAPVNAVPPPCPTSPPPTSGAGDRQPPTVPGTPTSVATCGVATLTWTASTDSVGVTGYEVWRASGTGSGAVFLLAATTATTSHTHHGVGVYQFEVRARDAAGNVSAFTPPITVYVPACPQSPPPSTPATANCTATYSAVNSWSGGFQGQVTVTNDGTNPTTSWTVTLT